MRDRKPDSDLKLAERSLTSNSSPSSPYQRSYQRFLSHRGKILSQKLVSQTANQWLNTPDISPTSSSGIEGPLSHPLYGYLFAVLFQMSAVLLIVWLMQSWTTFFFPEALLLLVVLIIALGWGAGPSIIATFVGALLFLVGRYLLLPHPHIIPDNEEAMKIGIYLSVGILTSILASQTQRARLRAENLSQRLFTVLEALPDAVILYDHNGSVVQMNRAARETLPSDLEFSLPTISQQFRFRTIDTQQTRELPLDRALHGETLVDEEVIYRVEQKQESQRREAVISAAPLYGLDGTTIDGAITIFHDISALRTAERESAERASQLETVFAAIAEGVTVYDTDGNILHMNPSAKAMFEQTSSVELLNRPLEERCDQVVYRDVNRQILPLEDLPLMRILRGERLINEKAATILLKSHDGADFWMSISGAPIITNGQITGAVVVTRNETERHRLLQRLQDSERESAEKARQLEAIFDTMSDGIVIIDAHSGSFQLNRSARNVLGIVNEDTLQWGAALPFALFDDHGQPLKAESWSAQRLIQLAQEQGMVTADVQLSTANGHKRSLSIKGAPLLDAQQDVQGVVLVCRDMTERYELEMRTRKALDALIFMAQRIVQEVVDVNTTSEQRARSLKSTIGNLLNLACPVLNCYRMSMVLFEPETRKNIPIAVVGLPVEEERRWWQEVSSAYLSDYLPDEYVQHLLADEMLIIDLVRQRPVERDYYGFGTTLSIPLVREDQLIGILTVDVQHERHVYSDEEVALARTVAQLIMLMIERDRMVVAQTEARANILALEETNRLMNEFLGIAAHEIRTPLTTIKMSIQLTQRQLSQLMNDKIEVSSQAKSVISTIYGILDRAERQAGRQARLVRDLLDVSRIQANRLELRPGEFDLVALVREVVEDQRVLLPERTILLDVPEGEELYIYADRDRVGQVVDNYLSNALKYSEVSKPVKVCIEHSNDQICVRVRDEGPGLSAEQQAKIWERFYRVPGINVKSGSGIGLGLGLHISRTIIERSNGQVGIESTPQAGSTFWFTLPVFRSITEQ